MAPDDRNRNAAQLLIERPRIFWGKVVALFIRRGWTPPPPDERITADLLEEFERTAAMTVAPVVDLPDIADAYPLTDRETQIVELLMVGYDNAQIADALGIAPQTVKYHLSNVYRKLGVTTRAQVVAMLSR